MDRTARVVPRRRIHHVVRPDHQRHIRPLELGIDVVHVHQFVVRDVRLGEQHIHVPRHAPRHRVDRELHHATALLDQVHELAHLVLRLRHRQAVPRDHDHLLRVCQLQRGFFDIRLLHHEPRRTLPARGRRRAERAEEHVRERAVHRLAHHLTQDDPRRTDQRTRDDQHLILDHEAGHRSGDS